MNRYHQVERNLCLFCGWADLHAAKWLWKMFCSYWLLLVNQVEKSKFHTSGWNQSAPVSLLRTTLHPWQKPWSTLRRAADLGAAAATAGAAAGQSNEQVDQSAGRGSAQGREGFYCKHVAHHAKQWEWRASEASCELHACSSCVQSGLDAGAETLAERAVRRELQTVTFGSRFNSWRSFLTASLAELGLLYGENPRDPRWFAGIMTQSH